MLERGCPSRRFGRRLWPRLILPLCGLLLLPGCDEDRPTDLDRPVCQASPATLDFGPVEAGSYRDLAIKVSNIGGGVLHGAAAAGCSTFAFAPGGSRFSLEAHEETTLTVRFAPVSPGASACSLDLGTPCGAVWCEGLGMAPMPTPACRVTPERLEFGSVPLLESREASFTIENVGGDTLRSRVTGGTSSFAIRSGGGEVVLAAGEAETVTVRFTSLSAGPHACVFDLGTTCGTVPCRGEGTEEPPSCEVSVEELDFGRVTMGRPEDRVFTIRNAGGGALRGTVTEESPSYSITSGGGDFILTTHERMTVTVRYFPTAAIADTCLISLGGCGSPVTCRGQGVEPPAVCEVVPRHLDFGILPLGRAFALSFTIRNASWGTLRGRVQENCAPYRVLSGSGGFALGPHEERTVLVRFEPTSPGRWECPIDLGSGYGVVTCAGTGSSLPPPPPVEMVLVPAGSFEMGSPREEEAYGWEDERQHPVTLTRDFWVSVHEVTQSEWQAVMGWGESQPEGADRPVDLVTWFDAVSYCIRRSFIDGYTPAYVMTVTGRDGVHITAATVTWNQEADGYRLLTEAEWEYACRAGSRTTFCSGPMTHSLCEPVDPNLDRVGWYCGNAGSESHDVGGREANAWGLRDMHGNAREWCWDWIDGYPSEVVVDPIGPASGRQRVVRGGSWDFPALLCRSAHRWGWWPEDWFAGVRLARTAR